MQPASSTPCASISRLSSPTGKLARASAPATRSGVPHVTREGGYTELSRANACVRVRVRALRRAGCA